jgi:hypothetical protein
MIDYTTLFPVLQGKFPSFPRLVDANQKKAREKAVQKGKIMLYSKQIAGSLRSFWCVSRRRSPSGSNKWAAARHNYIRDGWACTPLSHGEAGPADTGRLCFAVHFCVFRPTARIILTNYKGEASYG